MKWAILLKCCLSMLILRSFVLLLNQPFLPESAKSNAGRPPIDCVLMFKVLFLQRYYGLSDHQIEYQIVDRTSFRKFLGIECVDDVPDEKTVWKYRELLTNTGVYDKLFSEFHSFMESKGLQFNEGRIIDASFVIAPRQRNTRDENEQIKQERVISCGMTIPTRIATWM